MDVIPILFTKVTVNKPIRKQNKDLHYQIIQDNVINTQLTIICFSPLNQPGKNRKRIFF